jgi:GTPase SAR1 family protein
MLIGNKSDLKHNRSVRTEEARTYAEQNSLMYLETSALDNTNVELALTSTVKDIIKNLSSIQPISDSVVSVASKGISLDTNNTPAPASGCNC